MPRTDWWKHSVVYQIYPRSFCDSNGDGIGDLPGITAKLDYLKALGVDVIWLSPVYASPNDDNGYDISDYRAIMPEFGTLADFDRLLAGVHRRGMRLVMDLVVNHTSDEHLWFQEACKSRDNPFHDFYIWREPKPDGSPPTNWEAAFNGSVWEWNEPTGEYYLHMFSRKQPDLNWENPQVRAEVYDLMRFWLDRGVDGFRMDVINMISKPWRDDGSLPDAPVVREGALQPSFPMTCNGPRLLEFLQEMRRAVLDSYDTITVGEAPLVTAEFGRQITHPRTGALNMLFQFEHMDLDSVGGAVGGKWALKPLDLRELKATMARWQHAMEGGQGWNSLYLANHDQPRAVSRFGDDGEHLNRSAKMLALWLHGHQGTPYVYQGEELGLPNVPFQSIDEFRDIESINHFRVATTERGEAADAVMHSLRVKSRDNARTPMPWTAGPQGGFTTGTPWIGLNPAGATLNAQAEEADADSVLHFYRRLIALRRTEPALVDGRFQEILPGHTQIAAYLRILDGHTLLVLCNFGGEAVDFQLPEGVACTGFETVLSNLPPQPKEDLKALTLRPWEGRILRLQGGAYWHGPDEQATRLWRSLAETLGSHAQWPAFDTRVRAHVADLRNELAMLYGERRDFEAVVDRILRTAFEAWCQRSRDLRALDAAREADPHWFESQRMVGAVCYADLWAGNLKGLEAQIPYFKELGLTYLHLMPPFLCPEPHNDGGYAVSSYRAVQPKLGTIDDLRSLAAALRAEGISLVLDFVFNHTSDEHAWAEAARRGQAPFKDYYLLFPDREQPDAYERTLREIFPDEHPGAFSQLPDGRWVWTTFHSYQWDLNYANPEVFAAMAGEMLAIANLGVEFLRMDAVAFVWKRLGTPCENLPEAHALLKAYNAIARIAAPSLLFKSEAIVHPDDVVKYISPGECQVSYNPLQMALLWSSLATREVSLLQTALAERHHLPAGTAWVNYVRSHDDIGWTFADEDAARLGINGFDHRQFLNRFFVNRFPGSFARGVPFQDNPATGDCRISGTCASLCGLEQGDPHAVARLLLMYGVALSSGGIPLLYLGDEVGTPNDYGYAEEPGKADDSRWVHRPARDEARYAQRHDPSTTSGRIFTGMKRMIAVRRATEAFGGGRLVPFYAKNPAVLGYQRPSPRGPVLVLGNFSEGDQLVSAEVLSAMPSSAVDLLSGVAYQLRQGVRLGAYQQVWLDCRSADL